MKVCLNYILNFGFAFTFNIPLDNRFQDSCLNAANTQIKLQKQELNAKKLNYEIARLKNCGELMQKGIIFHPQSQYAAVCADVKLINPPGTLPNHTHTIEANPPVTGDASSLKTISIGNQ